MNRRFPRLHLVRSPARPGPMLHTVAWEVPRVVDTEAAADSQAGATRLHVWSGAKGSGGDGQQSLPDALTLDHRALMVAHGIEFDGRGFRFAGYRYDTLTEAVHQSRTAGQGCE